MQRKIYAPIPPDVEKIGKVVLDAAFKVHTALGPGLLESVYETCTAFELTESGYCAPTQVTLPVVYRDIKMDAGLRADIITEDCVILECKSVETMNPVYDACSSPISNSQEFALVFLSISMLFVSKMVSNES